MSYAFTDGSAVLSRIKELSEATYITPEQNCRNEYQIKINKYACIKFTSVQSIINKSFN